MKTFTFSPGRKQIHISFAAAIMMSLLLVAAPGCTTNVSSKGGVVPMNEEFSITVPASTTVKQGTDAPITVSLKRGPYFKRDVQLTVKAEGISVTPRSVLVAASDRPELQFQVATTRDTALGEYRVSVTGVPENGKPASTVFIIKVVTPPVQ